MVSVSIEFPGGAFSHCEDDDYSWADWDGLLDHLKRDAPLEDIFKLSASAACSECCKLVKFVRDV